MASDRKEIIEQANLAFDFIQRMYVEVSYLIKEIEGTLREEEEEFVIGRPSGYSINSKSSTGLESEYVKLWLLRRLAVFFVPKNKTKLTSGVTSTIMDANTKVLYLRILLNDNRIDEPAIYSGVLFDIWKKKKAKELNKFEHVMGPLQNKHDKIFKNIEKINYQDPSIKIKGVLIKNNLFEINDSEAILEKIVRPSVELFRKY